MQSLGDIEKAPTLIANASSRRPGSVTGADHSAIFPQGARRIQFVSAIMAIAGVVVMVGERSGRGQLSELLNASEGVADAIAIGASLLMFSLARWSRLRLATLVVIALCTKSW